MDLSPATYTWTVQDVTPPETFFLGAEEIGPEQFVEPGLRFTFRGDDDLGSSFELEFECAVHQHDGGRPRGLGGVRRARGERLLLPRHRVRRPDGGRVHLPGARARHRRQPRRRRPRRSRRTSSPSRPSRRRRSCRSRPAMGADLETTRPRSRFDVRRHRRHRSCARSTRRSSTPCSVAAGRTPTCPYGEHLFQVFAVGELGTPDSTPAEFEWVSGTDVAPDVTITTAPPATGGTATSGTIEFGSTDPDASFLCTLDGGPELPVLVAVRRTPTCWPASRTRTPSRSTATRADLLPSVALLDGRARVGRSRTTTAPDDDPARPTPTNPSGNEVDVPVHRHRQRHDPGEPRRSSAGSTAVDPWVGCSSPHTIPGPDRRNAHLRGARDRRDAAHRPVAREPHLERHRAAADRHHEHDAASATAVPEGEISTERDGRAVVRRPARLDVRVPPRPVDPDVDPFDAVHVAVRRTTCRTGRTCSRSGRTTLPLERAEHDSRARPREYSGRSTPPTRRIRTRRIQLGPANADDQHVRDVPLQRHGQPDRARRPDVRVLARRRPVRRLRERRRLHGSRRRRAHLRGAGDRHAPFRRTSTARRRPTRGRSRLPARTTRRRARTSRSSVGGATHHVRRGHGRRRHVGLRADRRRPAPDLPTGYFTAGALYYDVSTTATFVGDVTVCLPYDDARRRARPALRRQQWVDVTLEQQGDLVCGVVSSLSPFAVAEVSDAVAPETTIIQSPADPTIQSTGDGADVQFQFASTIDTSSARPSSSAGSTPTRGARATRRTPFNALFGEHTLLVRAVTEHGVIDATPAGPHVDGPRPAGRDDRRPARGRGSGDARTSRTRAGAATFEFSSDQAGSTFECRLTGEDTGTTWETVHVAADVRRTSRSASTRSRSRRSRTATRASCPRSSSGRSSTSPRRSSRSTAARRARSTRRRRRSPSRPTSRRPSSARSTARRSACASPAIQYTGLGLGQHTFDVRATDLSEGENVSAPVTRTWTVADLTAPTPDHRPDSRRRRRPTTTARVHLQRDRQLAAARSRSSAGSTAAAFAPAPRPTTYSGLSAGAAHVRGAGDGRAPATRGSASHTWTVAGRRRSRRRRSRTSRRARSSSSSPAPTTTRPPATSTFECRVDSAAYGACTSPKTYTDAELRGDDAGRPHLPGRARSTRRATSAQPDSHTFTVADTTAPDTSITGQPTADDDEHDRVVHVHGQRRRHRAGRPDLRVRARRRRPFAAVHLAEGVPGPDRRAAHLPGARDGRRGQRRRLAGELHVDDPGAAPTRRTRPPTTTRSPAATTARRRPA